jgi:hypothetical protein
MVGGDVGQSSAMVCISADKKRQQHGGGEADDPLHRAAETHGAVVSRI